MPRLWRSIEPSAAAAAADELVGAHILVPGRAYEFAHPVLQAAVYDGLGPARRAEAHARAARLTSASRGISTARRGAFVVIGPGPR